MPGTVFLATVFGGPSPNNQPSKLFASTTKVRFVDHTEAVSNNGWPVASDQGDFAALCLRRQPTRFCPLCFSDR